VRTIATTALLLGLGASLSACSECERTSRCEGDVLVWCNFGSDSQDHENRTPCEAPSSACVEVGDDDAKCVYGPAEACDETFVDRCEGSLRVYCDPALGWAEMFDCATIVGTSGTCGADPGSGVMVCLP
jgi:hypothetical protein